MLKPIKFNIQLANNEPSIHLPKLLLDLMGKNQGDIVYINLEDIKSNHDAPIISKDDIELPKDIYKKSESVTTYNEQNMSLSNFNNCINTNPLYKKTYDRLIQFIKAYENVYTKNPQKSMVAFYTQKGGLCWLEYKYPGLRKFPVYLAKGSYDPVDPDDKILYSSPTKKTFGNFPKFVVEKEIDIEYLVNLLEYAIKVIKK